MYDTLIGEFEEESTRTRITAQPFDENAVQVDEAVAAQPAGNEAQPKVKSSEELATEDTESWSDDPVRMYLTQMGEIPLLTRPQEIALAKRIEHTRRKFRTRLLECDYVIQFAFKILKRVHRGELPFDRTVQVSVTDRLEKEQILGRIGHNLTTMEVLLKRNRKDFITASQRVPIKKCVNRLGPIWPAVVAAVFGCSKSLDCVLSESSH